MPGAAHLTQAALGRRIVSFDVERTGCLSDRTTEAPRRPAARFHAAVEEVENDQDDDRDNADDERDDGAAFHRRTVRRPGRGTGFPGVRPLPAGQVMLVHDPGGAGDVAAHHRVAHVAAGLAADGLP